MAGRRHFLRALGGAAAVLGFDAASGTFLSEAAAQPGRTFTHLPPFEGTLLLDPGARQALSTDAGFALSETPSAVLRPASADDIAKLIRFCRAARIPVSARGQGHTTHGQSLTRGVLIDMSTLDAIHALDAEHAEVDAGITWRALVQHTLENTRVPPVLTGYLGLSVGGTLSMGGISSTVDRGAQIDHVRALEVVTGEGRIVRCSETEERALFHAALGGLGQVGIITRAWLTLTHAPALTRTYPLIYTDNATFFADMRALLARGEFDDVYALWVPGEGGFTYVLNAVKFHEAGGAPDDAQLLRELHDVRPALAVTDAPFSAYIGRVDAAVAYFESIGQWQGVLHPWFDVFLPGRSVEQYIGEVLPTLTPEDVGPTGFMLLFPQRRARFTRPMLRVPDDAWIFLFDILTANAAPGPDPAFQARMLARNRRLFERARALGGTRYPIGSLAFGPLDWLRHYGVHAPQVVAQTWRFDPSGILTPGIRPTF